jgi:hypothetical protein
MPPARALIEYDRVLLYGLAFVVFGALGHRPQALRWLVRGLAFAIVAVCACALVTRLARTCGGSTHRSAPSA